MLQCQRNGGRESPRAVEKELLPTFPEIRNSEHARSMADRGKLETELNEGTVKKAHGVEGGGYVSTLMTKVLYGGLQSDPELDRSDHRVMNVSETPLFSICGFHDGGKRTRR